MQISGANLLATQQMAAPAAAQPAAPGFAAMLQKAAGFTPRDLTRPEPAQTAAAPAEAKPAQATRPGMHIDLKV